MSVISTNPALPNDEYNNQTLKATVTGAKLGVDVETSRGAVEKALVVDFTIEGQKEVYSKLWSLDKKTIGGSAGRVLTKAKIKNVADITDSALSKLKNEKFTIKIKDNKQYWN